MNPIYVALVVGVLGGCVAEMDAETSSTEQFQKCPEWGCGENSPVAGPFRIRELNFRDANVDNGKHMRLLGFQKEVNGTWPLFSVDVLKDQVRAMIPGTTYVAFEHQGLVGGWFLLQNDEAEGYPAGYVRIYITEVSTQPFWQGTSGYVESYELKYTGIDRPHGADKKPLCNRAPAGTGIRNMATDPAEGKMWKERFHALIFSGDRYSETYEVSSRAPELSWLNIACAGSVVAKMHLNRHTAASNTTLYSTPSVARRQAMLKMYAGDFCGTGEAYTVAGTPIYWQSKTGQWSGQGNNVMFESMWNESGAMCMTTHRLWASQNTEYKDLGPEVAAKCPLQPCTSFPDYTNFNLYGNLFLTMSPH